MHRRRLYRNSYSLVAAMFLAGIAAGYSIAHIKLTLEERDFINEFRPLRANDEELQFVHALVAYDTPQATVLPEFAELKRDVQTIVNGALENGNVKSISVYYRDLERGRWIGIGEEESYYPASLLKVPIMIAYFKAEESDPSLLRKYITFETISTGTEFEAASDLVPGKSYTVQQLIEHMIIDSDNGATFTLLNRIDPDLLAAVYRRLGISDPGDDSATYKIPTRTYALFFRTLFNGTYLTPSASERALEILSRTTFKDGLTAGLPDGMRVAHKFGEHVLPENGTPLGEELHDCGIVYNPGHPYLLCVMTRAKTLDAAASAIRSISKKVYESTM